jgi:hypothetical protein
MSTVNYRYEQSFSFKKKGVKNTIRENVMDGSKKGLTIYYMKKEGDDKYYSVSISEDLENKDKFKMVEKVNDENKEKVIDIKELNKLLKTLKLDVISNYVSNERGMYKGRRIA